MTHRTRYARYDGHHRDAALPRAPRPAAGLLIRHTDDEGRAWWLLGLRAPKLGGKWSNLGGSIEHGELPLVAAAREFTEETNLPASVLTGATIDRVIECGTTDTPYTMFVLDGPFFTGARLGWEHDDLAWWDTDGVDALADNDELHPKFAAAWTALRVEMLSA